ncbi:unnamed protein product [Caenorhabditis bovis]|uniref:Ribosomal RNA-processing protein 8 n=1 Tax=Caenorhabditis bovis TaxID=2654633 RepID=A0A8S1F543_9PELO|nr:unnamed protein product [Caenorhabditis bovis]
MTWVLKVATSEVEEKNFSDDVHLDPIQEAKKRLDAARFRYLNERLYTITGNEAFEFFKEDPAAFECYHKGFAEQVRSFDLIAVNARVEECDMSKIPAEDGCADIVIFCLSLMGTNLYDFIREARRVLRIGGSLKIAEVSSRFSNVRMFSDAICKMGFENVQKKLLTNYFLMFEFRKIEKSESKRPYGLMLKPCLYKKR